MLRKPLGIVAVLACVSILQGCDDSANDNPGVTEPCMLDCPPPDGGFIPKDAGGPRLYVASMADGGEAVQWIDIGNDSRLKFPFSGLGTGLKGTPVSMVVDS